MFADQCKKQHEKYLEERRRTPMMKIALLIPVVRTAGGADVPSRSAPAAC
jgi:hypothetical protein